MEENIYQTPKAALAIDEEYKHYALATTTQRFFNLLLDLVFIMVFSGLVAVVLDLLGLMGYLDEVRDNVYGFIIMMMYYVPQEAIFGRTMGKLVTRTKVVDLNGNKISFMKALGRTLCRFVPFEGFTFLGGKGRPHGLHDKLPKTKVITLIKARA